MNESQLKSPNIALFFNNRKLQGDTDKLLEFQYLRRLFDAICFFTPVEQRRSIKKT